ncbi:MAG: LysR family transcriptional regulator [Polaromonas sp.]
MDIRSVDLNLLVVFDAMVEHRSVTRAAEALNLSQPAMSAAVARLRGIFDDPLFVRAGSEMRPTPRAAELAGPVHRVVDTVKTEILQRNVFDPASSDRTFTLVTPDIGEVNFVPRILSRLADEAPNTNIKTLAMPRHAASDSLESGAAELALGYFPDLQKAGFFQQKLFRNSHVCMVRSDHPLIGTTMTLAQFLALSHAVVQPDGREHVFEQYLHKRGLKRRVLVEISHFMSLLPIVEASDLVATVPRDVAEFCVRHGKVRIVETPMKAPVIDVYQFWHRRFHKDPAHIWLRSAVHALFRQPA